LLADSEFLALQPGGRDHVPGKFGESQVLVLLPIPVGRQHRQAAKSLLAFLERLLRMLALGDVLDLQDEMQGPPGRVAHQRAGHLPPDHPSVGMNIALLALESALLA
jgi:hypothetical protein